MLLDLIINFSILFTFVVLSYWIYESLEPYQFKDMELHPWIVGLVAGITSLLLMGTAVHFQNGIIGDARFVSILISGLVGGPIAIAVSSVIVGIFRFYVYGLSETSISAGVDILVIGCVLAFVSWKRPITFRNIYFYFTFLIVQDCIVIFILSDNWIYGFQNTIQTLLFNFGVLYVTLLVLKSFRNQFERMRKIEEMAETDYLTGLANNRRFQQVIDELLTNDEPFSLLLIDIDSFKKVNNTYGHPVGDEILQKIGAQLKDFVTTINGEAARISGEEFYVVCRDAAPAISIHDAHRIRTQIAKTPFVVSTGHVITITVSIGICSYPDNGKTLTDLAFLADRAVMKAIEKGQNQIVHVNQLNN
ncbi:diguanylate cyclase [Viridibacillus sp. YIM B01967]|uniref:Diguanylate cyclase n=1 Tax=Viridibacillus soli TaxID=2798301 RepID=A0ABS1H8D4_9BACL|nr:diguanylate cyclase [Viridibacillus soli]MBK3495682.1 diguanylate cyclase [Viridibacillus soli]